MLKEIVLGTVLAFLPSVNFKIDTALMYFW